jgi:adenylate cyclase
MPFGPVSNRRLLAAICLGWTLLIALLHVGEQRYRNQEMKATDWLTLNGAARLAPTSDELVYLGVDEATISLDALFQDLIDQSRALQLIKQGRPWNREVYALIIDRLAAVGAKVIILDVIFPTESPDDEKLREALLRHRDRVVIASELQMQQGDDEHKGYTYAHLVPADKLLPPGPDSWVGFASCPRDEDGLFRRFAYRTTPHEFFGKPRHPAEEELLSLSARALEKAELAALIPAGHSLRRIRPSEVPKPLPLYGIFVDDEWNSPVFQKGEVFRNKIVVIGESGNRSDDRVQTPAGTTLGPVLHLWSLNAALNQEFIEETKPWQNAALIVIAGLASWLLSAHVTNRPLRLTLLALLLASYYGGAQTLYNYTGLLPILLSPMLILAGSNVTWTVVEQGLDLRERRRVRQTFEKYVSPDVVSEILDNPATFLDSLGGERRDVTILFSDIRGFTTLTESADPQVLVTQLNEYFKEMVATVFAHEGTLDKFIGDAVMAHWGSLGSASEEQNALRAIRAALEMRKALVGLNEDWKPRGLPELHIGIGINHGTVIAGNIGASGAYERFDFTVLGDAVNLASRLEGVTKGYGLDLCLGEDVEALVRDAFVLRSVDFIRAKGKTRPVKVFTIVEERTAQTVEPAWLAHHEQAMRAYRAGDFVTAETGWLEVIAVLPDDPLAPIFLARCAQLIANPPGQSWTGVFDWLSK